MQRAAQGTRWGKFWFSKSLSKQRSATRYQVRARVVAKQPTTCHHNATYRSGCARLVFLLVAPGLDSSGSRPAPTGWLSRTNCRSCSAERPRCPVTFAASCMPPKPLRPGRTPRFLSKMELASTALETRCSSCTITFAAASARGVCREGVKPVAPRPCNGVAAAKELFRRRNNSK